MSYFSLISKQSQRPRFYFWMFLFLFLGLTIHETYAQSEKDGFFREELSLDGPCSLSGEQKIHPDPECYSIRTIEYIHQDVGLPKYEPMELLNFQVQEVFSREKLRGHSGRGLLPDTAKLQDPSGPVIPTIPTIPDRNMPRPQRPSSIDGSVIISQIMNIFDWAWKFIERGKALVTLGNLPFAAGLPLGVTDWRQLERWEMPVAQPTRIVAKNTYGITVAEVAYDINYTYGGSYREKGQPMEESRGRFLTNVTLVPRFIKAAWGFKVNVDVRVGSVLNFGTQEDPEAGVQLLVDHNIASFVTDIRETKSFIVRGNGGFGEVLASPVL